ncbi:hypothetical protein C8Q74DRAFT_1190409 [Fomes fomentarius]|nr:hypothetical protein C8Q74DRAFT_1190409 [Fomes fomentarius]
MGRRLQIAFGTRRVNILREEAVIYNTKLLALQGKYVPLVHGFHVGRSTDGLSAVLVMDDCGNRMSESLRCQPLATRVHVVEALLAIHQAGIQHNDLAERNIVLSSRTGQQRIPFIVDFGDATEHVCPVDRNQVQLDHPAPNRIEFGCDEMWEVCEETDTWAISTFSLLMR